MTLREVSYELLTIIRGGHFVDDERIDLRLLEEIIRQYRMEYINELNRTQKTIPESFVQEFNVPLSKVDYTKFSAVESTSTVPDIAIGRFGPMISGIYSPYVDEYSYTIVNRNQLRTSGNGKFNQNIVFISYYNGKLNLRSKNDSYLLMTDIDVAAILEDPTEAPGFDIETDTYPIDAETIPYIKDKMNKFELKLLLAQYSDEYNDADGEIEE